MSFKQQALYRDSSTGPVGNRRPPARQRVDSYEMGGWTDDDGCDRRPGRYDPFMKCGRAGGRVRANMRRETTPTLRPDCDRRRGSTGSDELQVPRVTDLSTAPVKPCRCQDPSWSLIVAHCSTKT